jgi:hypothetical protein
MIVLIFVLFLVLLVILFTRSDGFTEYYTNDMRHDAFGSQFLAMMWCIAYAEQHVKGTFVYSKPHLTGTYDEDESEKLEAVMNIRSLYEGAEGKNAKVISLPEAYDRCEENVDKYMNSETMDKIRECFFENKPPPEKHDEYKVVGVHVRRPSLHPRIDPDGEYYTPVKGLKNGHDLEKAESSRYMKDEYVLSVMNKIRSDGGTYKFYICSEGDPEDFDPEFKKAGDVEFFLNKPISDTYYLLATADILIMTKSTFSYTAGFLNTNTVYYKDGYRHPPLNRWIKY